MGIQRGSQLQRRARFRISGSEINELNKDPKGLWKLEARTKLQARV